MGYTKYGERRHLVSVYTGYEVQALCGAKVIRFIENIKTNEPIPYRDYWQSNYYSCEHCDRIQERMESLKLV